MYTNNKMIPTHAGGDHFGGAAGFEEADLCAAGVKNMPVACFLGRGRIHVHPDAPSGGVDGCT